MGRLNPQYHDGVEPQRAGDLRLPMDEAACTRLLAAFGPMVKAVCQRILSDPALAEDAAQEVFLLLVRKLPSLPGATLLGGWLYLTACRVARTHRRAHSRRVIREREPEAMQHLMSSPQDGLWQELAPLVDAAMLTLPERQRELVLFRYFQDRSQREAAALVGCSESVASRELACALERLRRFFAREGVTVSTTTLAALMVARAAPASAAVGGLGTTLAGASSLAGALKLGIPIFSLAMKTTTSLKIAAGLAGLALLLGSVSYWNLRQRQAAARLSHTAAQPGSRSPASLPSASQKSSTQRLRPLQAVRQSAATGARRPKPDRSNFDEATLKAAREQERNFWKRVDELALSYDPKKVQAALLNEFGILASTEEVADLMRRGQKGFRFGVIEFWAARQPQQALAWAASALSEPSGDWAFQKLFLDGARKALPNLTRETVASMLPDAPGTSRMLDLVEASSDPASLASRILAEDDAGARESRLRLLALGWRDSQQAAAWARDNLSGAEKAAFYDQVSYNLAHADPDAALAVLAELKGADTFASAFARSMRGLVQIGGRGEEAAALIAQSDLKPNDRAELISELSRRWVRNDPEATVAWVNTLTAPEDFRAAIPLLVSQLENADVTRTVEGCLKNHDPVMERALIEAAAPPGLMFDPNTSRLILDPLIQNKPDLQVRAAAAGDSSQDAALWHSINATAKRQAEVGNPSAAMEWLAQLPFASPSDYAEAAAHVLSVWKLRSAAEAEAWVQSSVHDATARAELLKAR